MIDLSVCITTYNLEKAIDKTLESVLGQRTSYSYEVLIGDDGSDDETLKKIFKWEKRYPSIIRHYVMPRKENEAYNPIFRASLNRINLLNNAKGKYITFLDGDDFYIDENKFEKQINILENYQQCSLCAHNMNYYYPDSNIEVPMGDIHMKEGIISPKKYWKRGIYFHSESCIMRNQFNIPQKYERYFDDNFIVFLALQHGACYYIPDIMADYRQNPNGFNKNEKLKIAIINMLDCDMEIQYNFEWEKESLCRHRYDYKLLLNSAKKFGNIFYHVLGPIANGLKFEPDNNILFEGAIEHNKLGEKVKEYDALIMPFTINEIILSVDPVKLYEYINFGKCIISVWYPEIERFRPFVYFYKDETEYMELINMLSAEGFPPKYSEGERRTFLSENSWEARYALIKEKLEMLDNENKKI